MANEQKSKLCKVVYFDEDSVTDYVQIVAGGKLEKTTELLNESGSSGGAGADVKASVGLGGVLKALIGFEASASVEASLDASFSTGQMARNIVKNTILSDFIELTVQNSSANEVNKAIHSFKGYEITAPKESLSYIALISPYFSMLKSGTSIPAGDFNIAIDKLDNTIKSAKGYFEFVGQKQETKVIFRFNINAFKNSYKPTDLSKMNLTIYAIKVGMSNINELDFNSELGIDGESSLKDNPSYCRTDLVACSEKLDEALVEVFDVLLAGVEFDD